MAGTGRHRQAHGGCQAQAEGFVVDRIREQALGLQCGLEDVGGGRTVLRQPERAIGPAHRNLVLRAGQRQAQLGVAREQWNLIAHACQILDQCIAGIRLPGRRCFGQGIGIALRHDGKRASGFASECFQLAVQVGRRYASELQQRFQQRAFR